VGNFSEKMINEAELNIARSITKEAIITAGGDTELAIDIITKRCAEDVTLFNIFASLGFDLIAASSNIRH
jgi:hypothetical protein